MSEIKLSSENPFVELHASNIIKGNYDFDFVQEQFREEAEEIVKNRILKGGEDNVWLHSIWNVVRSTCYWRS